MSKQYKKSRAEDLATRKMIANKGWSTKNDQPIKIRKELNGRHIPMMISQETDQSKEMEKYTPEMFYLENLEEINAIDKTKDNRLEPSTLQTIDYTEAKMGKLETTLDAQEWAEKWIKQQQKQEEDKQ